MNVSTSSKFKTTEEMVFGNELFTDFFGLNLVFAYLCMITITIGQLILAAKEVKSGLHYLNENPLLFFELWKKYFRA